MYVGKSVKSKIIWIVIKVFIKFVRGWEKLIWSNKENL